MYKNFADHFSPIVVLVELINFNGPLNERMLTWELLENINIVSRVVISLRTRALPRPPWASRPARALLRIIFHRHIFNLPQLRYLLKFLLISRRRLIFVQNLSIILVWTVLIMSMWSHLILSNFRLKLLRLRGKLLRVRNHLSFFLQDIFALLLYFNGCFYIWNLKWIWLNDWRFLTWTFFWKIF